MWISCLITLSALTLAYGDRYYCKKFSGKYVDIAQNRGQQLRNIIISYCNGKHRKNVHPQLTYNPEWECVLHHSWAPGKRNYAKDVIEVGPNGRGEQAYIWAMPASKFCGSAAKHTQFACGSYSKYNGGWWENSDEFGCVFYSDDPEPRF